MRGKIIASRISPHKFPSNSHGQFDCRSLPCRLLRLSLRREFSSNNGTLKFSKNKKVTHFTIKSVSDGNQGCSLEEEEEEDDDELCPVECVREFKTDEELFQILDKAKKANALVVVDFYRTSCGSCKYIEQGFSKLCKASGEDDVPVIFLKHNVMDEYDEQSEVAERLRIKKVPLFHFYKDGTLLEAFPTRDKERITEAILKYTSPAPKDSLN